MSLNFTISPGECAMAENLRKRPSKGILKTTSSYERTSRSQRKQIKWDEMNIVATFHPNGKEYGHMKVREPLTPFTWLEDTKELEMLDASVLAEKICRGTGWSSKAGPSCGGSDSLSDESTGHLAEREYATGPKIHYTEYFAVELARRLLEAEDDDSMSEDKSMDYQQNSASHESSSMDFTSEQFKNSSNSVK